MWHNLNYLPLQLPWLFPDSEPMKINLRRMKLAAIYRRMELICWMISMRGLRLSCFWYDVYINLKIMLQDEPDSPAEKSCALQRCWQICSTYLYQWGCFISFISSLKKSKVLVNVHHLTGESVQLRWETLICTCTQNTHG